MEHTSHPKYILPKTPSIRKKPIEIKKENINVETIFHTFKNDRVQPYSTVPGMTVHTWIARRKEAYRKYQKIFHPNNLHNLPQVKKDFKEWLFFKNNLSWSRLHRTGYKALDEPEKLANLLWLLQNKDIEISERVDRGLKTPEKVPGIAEGILTALLHTFNPESCVVVNSKTRDTLEILRRESINIYHSETKGQKYVKINKVLHELANELKTDLVYTDGFMWYVSKHYSFI